MKGRKGSEEMVEEEVITALTWTLQHARGASVWFCLVSSRASRRVMVCVRCASSRDGAPAMP